MTIGSMHLDMNTFKMTLASHVIKHGFEYDIEKNNPGRYKVHYIEKVDGCR